MGHLCCTSVKPNQLSKMLDVGTSIDNIVVFVYCTDCL